MHSRPSSRIPRRSPEDGFVAASGEAPAPEPRTHAYRLSFQGTGEALFLIYLKNIVLTVLTLGVYYAWGRVNVLRYLYANFEVDGARLRFDGRGLEVFKGLLLVLGVYLLFLVAQVLTTLIAGELGMPWLSFAEFVVAIALVVWLVGYAVWTSYRYRFSRTLYREIRFGVRGSPKKFANGGLPRALATYFTLGLYLPFLSYWINTRLFNATHFGSLPVTFDPPKREYVRRLYKGFFLSVLTLGVYFFFWKPKWVAFIRRHTRLGQSTFRSTFGAGEFFALHAGNLALFVFTLGLGSAWIRVRTARFYAEHTWLEGPTSLDEAVQVARVPNGALGEALGDAFDIGAGLDFGL